MDIGFGEAVLLFGGLLAVVAALSGLMRGRCSRPRCSRSRWDRCSPRPASSTSTPTDQSIVELVELALILTLFSDGMFVERELLRRHWSPVARALVIAMPITMVLLALAAKALFPDLELGRGVPARRGALADRPGRHLGGGHLAPRPGLGPPHAQPRVRASTTGWRCPSSSSSSSSPRPAAMPAPKRRSWSARRSSAPRSASPSARSAAASTTTCPAAA